MAFLESQTWGHQLKQLLAEPLSAASGDAAAQVAGPWDAGTEGAGARFGKWLALAASLLLAFSLGWATKGPTLSEQVAPDLAQTQPEMLHRQAEPLREAFPPALSADAVTLLVRDTQGQQQRLQVPLLAVEQLDDRFVETLPAELRDHFHEQGYSIQRRRRFAPMFFEQNEQLVPMVVPVDDTKIVPVNRPVF